MRGIEKHIQSVNQKTTRTILAFISSLVIAAQRSMWSFVIWLDTKSILTFVITTTRTHLKIV
jgi:hypothetical protein